MFQRYFSYPFFGAIKRNTIFTTALLILIYVVNQPGAYGQTMVDIKLYEPIRGATSMFTSQSQYTTLDSFKISRKIVKQKPKVYRLRPAHILASDKQANNHYEIIHYIVLNADDKFSYAFDTDGDLDFTNEIWKTFNTEGDSVNITFRSKDKANRKDFSLTLGIKPFNDNLIFSSDEAIRAIELLGNTLIFVRMNLYILNKIHLEPIIKDTTSDRKREGAIVLGHNSPVYFGDDCFRFIRYDYQTQMLSVELSSFTDNKFGFEKGKFWDPALDSLLCLLDTTMIALKDKKRLYFMTARWCGPCQLELPYLAPLAKKLKQADVEFVTLICRGNETQEIVDTYLNEHKHPGKIVIIDPKDGPNLLGIGYNFSFPQYFLISEEGQMLLNRKARGDEVMKEVMGVLKL